MSNDFEYVIPESLNLNLSIATFNNLQDSYLWDWTTTHLRIIGVKKGWEAPAALSALLKFMEGKADTWPNQPGGAHELVQWILDTEDELS